MVFLENSASSKLKNDEKGAEKTIGFGGQLRIDVSSFVKRYIHQSKGPFFLFLNRRKLKLVQNSLRYKLLSTKLSF